MIARKLQTVGANGLYVAGYNVGTTANPSVCTIPDGGEIGDLIIHLQIYYAIGSVPTLTPPTGFTSILVTGGTSTYGYKLHLSYQVTTTDRSGETVIGTQSGGSDGALIVVVRNPDGITSVAAQDVDGEFSADAIGAQQILLTSGTGPLVAIASFSQFTTGTTATSSGRTVSSGVDPTFKLLDSATKEEIYLWLYDDDPTANVSPFIGDGGLVNIMQSCYLEVTV